MIRGQSKWLIGALLLSLMANIVLAIRLQYPAAWHRWRLAMIPPPQLTVTDHIRGPADTTIPTVIVYTNYECTYCAKLNADLIILASELKFRWGYRHKTHQNQTLAFKAAAAAECAGDQGQFWEYNDQLFANLKTLSAESLQQIAEQMNLDMTDFIQCTSSEKYKGQLITAGQQADNLRVTATPTYFINGKRYVGSKPYAELKQLMLAAH